MKKGMEQVLQKNVEVGHACKKEQLEQQKINVEEAVTFHCGEQNELEDVTENTKPKII
jgi:hypothetical protein